MGSLKQFTKSLIEIAGLGKAVDRLRFYSQYIQKKAAITSYQKANPNLPLPTPFMIYETFRLDYER